MGRENIQLILRYLLKYLEEEFEGKIILKSILVFKDLKYSINKNSFSLIRLNPFLDLTP